ncbi:MAG: hypothetical protein ACJAZ0_003093 [Halioglobus sp.]|jgi:hypothetical protein
MTPAPSETGQPGRAGCQEFLHTEKIAAIAIRYGFDAYQDRRDFFA